MLEAYKRALTTYKNCLGLAIDALAKEEKIDRLNTLRDIRKQLDELDNFISAESAGGRA